MLYVFTLLQQQQQQQYMNVFSDIPAISIYLFKKRFPSLILILLPTLFEKKYLQFSVL